MASSVTYQSRISPAKTEKRRMERSRIQRLYEACTDVFSKPEPPNFRQIQWLRHLLDQVEAEDVGFGKQGGFPFTVSEITYIHIYECEDFSMGVFCFPQGGKLPLHDHPEMTVLTKVLYGSVYVKAYDWVLPTKMENSTCKTVGLGGLVVDDIFEAPCEPSVLFPRSGGNIHSLTALTPCAILDVLSPPYSDESGRPSTYFSEFPICSIPGYAVLEEKEFPCDLKVKGAPYLGPEIDFC